MDDMTVQEITDTIVKYVEPDENVLFSARAIFELAAELRDGLMVIEYKRQRDSVRQIKDMIETYEDSDKRHEDGVILGMFYCLNLLEHGKEYADKKIVLGCKRKEEVNGRPEGRALC